MLRSLVGSEMCIRDSSRITPKMASSSGLDLKAVRNRYAALQILFDRARAMGSLRLFRPHHFQQLSKQRQDIGLTIQLSCPSKPFLYPEFGESGPIARAQAVSTPNFFCQPSSGTPDSSFHTTNGPAHPPRAHKLRFFDVRGPEYGYLNVSHGGQNSWSYFSS